MHKTKNKAFTLVELIVVITILAILGTIAFISLQGYSTDARDSTRISDLSSMKTSLEVFHLDAGKYPVPTNGVDITYSGGVVWTQGSFGESVFSNVNKLDKIPTDPLTNKEYTYSITSNKNEFELAGLVEGDNISNNFLQNKANAGTTEAKAIVTGTYNGMMSKSLTGSNCDALATPTIIANDISINTDLVQLINSGSLVYTGYKNLPATFKDSKFKYDGGFDFSPNKILVYTDTGSCANLTNKTDATARISMLKGLQDAYSGTILQNEGDIQRIISMTINESSPSSELISYAASFVNNNLGGEVALEGIINNEIISQTNTLKSISDCISGGQIIYGTEDGTDTGLNCTNDIIICSGSGTGYTIAACNAGANSVYYNQTFLNDYSPRDNNINSWAGGLYQWGNNTDLSVASISTVKLNCTENSTFSGINFISGDTDYCTSRTDNMWGYNGGNGTKTQMKGPCELGYHVPKKSEWIELISAGGWGTDGTSFIDDLKIPMGGYKSWNGGGEGNQGQYGNYWTSEIYVPENVYLSGEYITFYGKVSGNPSYKNILTNTTGLYRSFGLSVRCFKN
ncbi:MAG: prepilin-type N-terminal cleavage/methylation domain-containing protein [Candidatus Gracilibacteria bacterium]|nr:prepilin-type N-terminal cleavage/methylation domain-containing protein [Candidatus Gracilibacteria bacterium]